MPILPLFLKDSATTSHTRVILSAAQNLCIGSCRCSLGCHSAAKRRNLHLSLLLPLSVLALTVYIASIAPQAAATTASPIHGAALFATNGCAHCHGPAGSGGDRGPDLKDLRRRMTAVQVATQIHDGGQSMPPFGDALTPQDITDLVAYLRATHKPPPPPPAPEPLPVPPPFE